MILLLINVSVFSYVMYRHSSPIKRVAKIVNSIHSCILLVKKIYRSFKTLLKNRCSDENVLILSSYNKNNMSTTENSHKKRIVFIINPISGTQSKRLILKYIRERMDRNRFDYEVVKTQYAGHATEIAAEAVRRQVDVVVAIGGDGTINETARSLVHSNTALGIIPCGSGNGLARHLRIPMDPKAAVDLINQGNVVCIDYGKINDVLFFCTCGVGFDAFVSLKFADSGKRGLLTYLENTLHESLTYEPETYEIENEEGTKRYKAFLIACGNASQYGNNAYITPQASLTDGLMDVTIMEPFTVLDVPSLSFQLFNKTLDQNSRIKTLRARKIRILRSKPGVMHYDGDPMMAPENLEVEIIPKGLHVVASDEKVKNESMNLLQQISEYFSGLKPKGEEFLAKRQSHLFELNRTLLRKLSKK